MRIYGKAGLLAGLVGPAFAIFMNSAGTPISTEARVVEGAERDAQRMVNDGYRVVSSEWYQLPLGLGYQKVIYEPATAARTTH